MIETIMSTMAETYGIMFNSDWFKQHKDKAMFDPQVAQYLIDKMDLTMFMAGPVATYYGSSITAQKYVATSLDMIDEFIDEHKDKDIFLYEVLYQPPQAVYVTMEPAPGTLQIIKNESLELNGDPTWTIRYGILSVPDDSEGQ